MTRTKKNLPPSAAKTNSPFKKKPGKGAEATDNECPYGHEFGVDTDSFNDCEKCDLWDACNEAKNNNA